MRADDFVELIAKASRQLSSEQGRFGSLYIVGKLIQVDPGGKALVVGDLHGDLESLIDIFRISGFLQKLEQSDRNLIVFLGDYGDRGVYSVEVYYAILSLKLLFPKQVVMIRGNHEGPDDLRAVPEDLPEQLQARFEDKWKQAYSELRKLFPHLYNGVIVGGRVLLVHGGVSPQIRGLEDLAFAHEKYPAQRVLEDILWSDPDENVEAVTDSPRGAGNLFGSKVTDCVFARLGVKVLIRGHEPCEEGYKINHEGRILTLFSRKGPPYYNAHGAYLDLDLLQEYDSAEELIPYIHKF